MDGSELSAAAIGTVTGVLASLVTFRTRLYRMDRDRKDLADKVSGLARRQRVTLEIMVDVARKVGADNRVSDLLAKFLVKEDDGE